MDGFYKIRVESLNGIRGEYFLNVTGQTFSPEPFAVTATDPVANVRLDDPPTNVTVDFANNVLLSSLDASDLTVNGVSATGYSVVDSDTIVFMLSTIGMGAFNVEMAEGSVTDFLGRPLSALDMEIVIPAHAVRPAGGLIYTHTTRGTISGSGHVESFALQLDSRQKVTVIVGTGTHRPNTPQ